MINLKEPLIALNRAGARFVVVGGAALVLHGSAYVTNDLDLAYERTRENAERIVQALKGFSPRPRGLGPELPYIFDAQALLSSEILTLETSAGDIDLLGEIKGIGSFAKVLAASEEFELAGIKVFILSIEGLIAAKTAAGRPKDEPGLVELRALRDALHIRDAEGPGVG